MGEDGPTKADITAVFKKLRSYAANKSCFDCGASNPTWASVTYGVFICIDCSAIHRGLGVHVSFVRSTQLDTNWTWLQIRAMQVGGNVAATQFFRQHGCLTSDAQQKYKSRAAQLYREKLHHSAVQAMRMHGTKLHIETHDQLSPSPGQGAEDKDFFAEHTEDIPRNESQASMSEEMYITPHHAEPADGEGPNVEGLDRPDSPKSQDQAPKRAMIGQRKPAGKKGGGKKGGLGAQKVSVNFKEIEQKAETFDKEREEAALRATEAAVKIQEEPDPDVTKLSSRLMVQDIGKEREKAEERARSADPKKVEQVERLGMGFSRGGGVSHSVVSDIQTIRQEGVRGSAAGKARTREPDYEDDWEILKEPTSRRSGLEDLNGGTRNGRGKEEDDFFSTMLTSTKPSQPDFSSGAWTTTEERGSSGRGSGRAVAAAPSAASSDEASKRFGGAKAISSEQFFGNSSMDYETRANLSRFDGATGIGSAELFGTGQAGAASSSSAGVSAHMPEVGEIKDSLRQGASKVAGKLANLSSSVQGYISDYYGY